MGTAASQRKPSGDEFKRSSLHPVDPIRFGGNTFEPLHDIHVHATVPFAPNTRDSGVFTPPDSAEHPSLRLDSPPRVEPALGTIDAESEDTKNAGDECVTVDHGASVEQHSNLPVMMWNDPGGHLRTILARQCADHIHSIVRAATRCSSVYLKHPLPPFNAEKWEESDKLKWEDSVNGALISPTSPFDVAAFVEEFVQSAEQSNVSSVLIKHLPSHSDMTTDTRSSPAMRREFTPSPGVDAFSRDREDDGMEVDGDASPAMSSDWHIQINPDEQAGMFLSLQHFMVVRPVYTFVRQVHACDIALSNDTSKATIVVRPPALPGGSFDAPETPFAPPELAAGEAAHAPRTDETVRTDEPGPRSSEASDADTSAGICSDAPTGATSNDRAQHESVWSSQGAVDAIPYDALLHSISVNVIGSSTFRDNRTRRVRIESSLIPGSKRTVFVPPSGPRKHSGPQEYSVSRSFNYRAAINPNIRRLLQCELLMCIPVPQTALSSRLNGGPKRSTRKPTPAVSRVPSQGTIIGVYIPVGGVLGALLDAARRRSEFERFFPRIQPIIVETPDIITGAMNTRLSRMLAVRVPLHSFCVLLNIVKAVLQSLAVQDTHGELDWWEEGRPFSPCQERASVTISVDTIPLIKPNAPDSSSCNTQNAPASAPPITPTENAISDPEGAHSPPETICVLVKSMWTIQGRVMSPQSVDRH